MTAWLIWTSARSVEWEPSNPELVLIKSKRKPGFARRDQIALVEGDFPSKSRLIAIAEIQDLASDRWGELFSVILRLNRVRPITHETDLDMLSFSLEFVRNLREPWRHFIRPYRRISSWDIAVLTSGEIFWSRTAFLTFYMTLDPQQRFDVQRVSFEKTGRALENLTYDKKWEVLKEYLQEELLAFGALFENIASAWQDLGNEAGMPQLTQLYFGTPDNGQESRATWSQRPGPSMDSIGRQHARFRGLDGLFGIDTGKLHQNAALFSAVDEQESRFKLRIPFEERFKGRHDT